MQIDIAMVHHYRNLELPNDNVQRQADDTMLKYKDELIKNVNKTWSALGDGVEMDIPIDRV